MDEAHEEFYIVINSDDTIVFLPGGIGKSLTENSGDSEYFEVASINASQGNGRCQELTWRYVDAIMAKSNVSQENARAEKLGQGYSKF